jgi:asparagine synthase (glutamine-hydrolysing)
MCGITGIFNPDKGYSVDRNLLISMRDSMIHRGPDEAGIFRDNNIGMAHRRLSIIDLASGQQPMRSSDDTHCIVFNGEIYNYRELQKYCRNKGCTFSTNSDTEVILNLYKIDGVNCVDTMRGMFAFAIWDRVNNQLFCARDRLGKKPFFYTLLNNTFYFASEIKALLKIPDFLIEPDYESLDAFLTLNYIPTRRTAFKNIFKLGQGCHLTVKQGILAEKKYWNLPDYRSEFELDTNEISASGKLLDLFDDAVKIRLVSEVPLGAFLSGGVDSTSVVARMKHHSEKPVITTTVGFDVAEFDESEIALNSSKFYETDHKFFNVVPDAEEVLQKVVKGFDEPFADISAIPTYYVCELARQNVTVALSGDGGDEQFAGYNWYPTYVSNRSVSMRIPPLAKPVLSLGTRLFPDLCRGKSYISSLSQSNWDALLSIRSAFTPSEKIKLYTPSFYSSFRNNSILNEIKEDVLSSTVNMNALRRMQYFDIKYYLTDDILVKVDRMSMLNSLEVRAPLLDHQLIEHVWSLPSALKLHENQRKYIFKKAIKHQLPPGLLNHPKKGFTPPVGEWLKKPLRDFSNDVLLSQKLKDRGLLNTDVIKHYIKQHLSENRFTTDVSTRLWSILVMELWFREYIDKT